MGKHGVSAAVLLDHLLVADGQLCLGGRGGAGFQLGGVDLLHEALRHDDARAAIGKPPAVGAGACGAKVVGLSGIELIEQAEKGVPEEVDVGLEEDVPLGLWVHGVGLVDHGQELEAVQPPSGLGVVDRVALGLGLLVLGVGLEVVVAFGVGEGQLGQDVDDVVVAELLVVVGDDEQVRDARGDGGEVGLELGGVGGARLEDDLDVIELLRGEVLAEVGVEAGLVLQRGEEALGGGLVVDGRGRRRRCGAAAGQGHDEEDEKETAEQHSRRPAREAQGQRCEDGHGGDAEERLVRRRARNEREGDGWANWAWFNEGASPLSVR